MGNTEVLGQRRSDDGAGVSTLKCVVGLRLPFSVSERLAVAAFIYTWLIR
jgi:hypothetical protein